ncbi:ribonuclease R [Ihubacter massiliensis]|uniref:Ribonuclease R n=1 Tax=Hominibacterium faecale TaxID=2839743 RepID=A0A9J6QXY8_9FIRM|nr:MULTISPECIES: ribonuclease R [Eubacteriales Family XIII. Incertae Sedis]MCO7123702.1 ribonuclease R [Ihubacter massiliensis]MCU7380356.1 ribonuclease R [Hominibacterium faecale]
MKRPETIGTLSKHRKGFGFVITEDEEPDIYISARSMGGAMNGDRVLVELNPQSRGNSREGVIVKIVERCTKELVGTFEKSKRFGFVVADDPRMGEDIFVRKKDFRGAQRGDKVMVQITRYPDKENSAEGKITEIISRSGQAGGDIKALMRGCGLRETFPSRVNAEAKAVSKAGVEEKDLAGRRDLREKTTLTIDGADSKDFDDAVSIELLPGGNFLLGVHIADVAHYVKEGGYLDQEALKRGNSVYLIDQVVPMLPKKLSNGICSLNPDVGRLTLSVDMEVTPQGDVVNHDIYESVIHSKARMVYSEVSDMLETNDLDLIKKHREVYEDILIMDKLAKILRQKREARGSLDFDFDEAYITLDESGIPVSVDIAERRTANKLIEEFMLLANQTVAEHFYWMEIPFVYRIHESPSPEKMEEFRTFLRGFGLTLKGASDSIHPKTLNDILDKVSGKTYENVINTVMLRSMQKAFYGTECGGHFGLSLKYYCHFTSPIRRYPDLIIHRIIKACLRGKLDGKTMKHFKKKTLEAAEISSATERQAIELERQVEKLKKAEYISYHVGESFDGVISGVTSYGIYVQLANTIEGMIRLDSLTDDYYIHEPEKYRVIGERTHKAYMLGERIRVTVDSVSIENREINFVMEEV